MSGIEGSNGSAVPGDAKGVAGLAGATRGTSGADGSPSAPGTAGATGRVLHTGQAIVDVVMRVAAMPPVGGDVYARSSTFTAGGGFNVMAAAARDGGDVVYLGAYGDGPFGAIVRDALAAEGVSTPAPAVRGQDTGYCVAIVEDSAERTFVSYLGAEGQVTLDKLRAVDVRPADVVYVTGYSLLHEINRESLLAWVPTLPDGARVVFDPSPLVAEIPEDAFTLMVRAAWLWTLNAREAGLALARLGEPVAGRAGGVGAGDAEDGGDGAHEAGGSSGPDGFDGPSAARSLASLVAGRVLVRSGSEGAFLAGDDSSAPLVPAPGTPTASADPRPDEASGVVHIPAMPVTPVDTNGAGDAHTGVLAAHLAQGGNLVDAIRRANVAAAVAVTRPGPATSPTSVEIDALLS